MNDQIRVWFLVGLGLVLIASWLAAVVWGRAQGIW